MLQKPSKPETFMSNVYPDFSRLVNMVNAMLIVVDVSFISVVMVTYLSGMIYCLI
jgi:hypothetical protein